MDNIDPRNHTHFTITDLYNKNTGEHLSSVAKYPDGTVIWEDGPTPSKNIQIVDLPTNWPWEKDKKGKSLWRRNLP